ncbi:MAG: site-specific DNA-methyltransferase [Chloroflexota bacterium]|nr:site-specific DNA-methyltransferase [Chloroflexota bacterium]MDE2951560.1 site-specific DNA-methyltransferase [Chloroflexota bacterium]
MAQIQMFSDTNISVKSKDIPAIDILPAADVLETLGSSAEVNTVILDPWYNKGVGGTKPDYHEWLATIICAACEISEHVFVWGFPEILAYQIPNLPKGFALVSWLTWYYKNCPSVIRGWRSAQNACLHLAREGASVYPEHFLNKEQLARFKAGKMRFVPGPPSVIEAPLNIGFIRQNEQTGHPAQKPLAVIKPLILMSTQADDTVLDPMCGSGTTGEACLQLNRRAVLCDHSEEYLSITEHRIANYSRSKNGG